MKKRIFTMIGLAAFAMADAQNGTSGPLGLYGSLYDAGTTINSGGTVLVGSGGLWYMAGNITSADKGGPNAPSAAGRTEVITFDGSGTYGGAATAVGTTGNVVNGYAAGTAAWTGTVLPVGNATRAYPVTVPAGTAVTAAYFDGSGSSQNKMVTGFTQSTTEFSQYYDFPAGIPAGSYSISYPAGLAPGNNALLGSGNTSSTGTGSGTAYGLLANIPNIGTSAGTVIAALPAITATQAYLSTSSVALPVTLINFTGISTTAGNLLSWQAANAVNFSHFGVQRSTDANSFATLGSVAANATGSYTYTDATATGTAYYRIAMVDLDGTTSYSKIVELAGGASGFALQAIYPVPATSALNVTVYVPVATDVTYTVTDMGGRVLGTELHAASGITNRQLDVSRLARGTYILTIATGGGRHSARFTKL